MTIRSRIILQSLAFMIIAAVITNGFLLVNCYQTLLSSSHEKAANLVGERAQAMTNTLGNEVATLQTMASMFSVSLARKTIISADVLKDYLNDEMDKNENILGSGWFIASDTVQLGNNSKMHLNRTDPNNKSLPEDRRAFFLQQENLYIGSRFDDPGYNEPYLTIYQPLKTLAGTKIGGVYFDLSLKGFQKMLTGGVPFEGGYFSLFDATGVYLSHPKTGHIGQSFRKMDQFSGTAPDTPEAILEALQKGESFQLVKFSKSTGTSVLRYYHPVTIKQNMALTLAVSLPVAALTAPFFAQLGLTLGLLISLVAVNIIVLVFLLSHTLGPLRTLKMRVQEWASGDADLTLTLPQGDHNEVGDVSRALNTFRENLRLIIVSLQDQTAALESLSSQLKNLSQQSASATEEMAAASNQAAQASERQLSQTDSTKTSIEAILTRIARNHKLTQEMSQEIQQFHNALSEGRNRNRACFEQVKHTENLVDQLHTTGEDGKKSMVALRDAVTQVSHRAQEIQEIASFILDIADRTNLLSMNAAIEAARAGASGRGFAVVSGEIRKLAESSSQQAQGIKKLLDGIAQTVEQTLKQSDQADQTFEKLHQDIGFVRTASQEISRVMEAQERFDNELDAGLGRFITFANQLANTMDANVQESRTIKQELETLHSSSMEIRQAMTEQTLGMRETATATQQVRETSADMGQIVQSIHSKIDRFKT